MGERASDARVNDIEVVITDVDTNEDTEAARIEIERTRERMGETLDTIGERLAPERFKEKAVEAAAEIKQDALEAVSQVKHDAIDTATHLKEAAVEAARAATQEVLSGVRTSATEAYTTVMKPFRKIEGAGMTLIDTIKQNPIPAAMIALGAYWLYENLEESKRIHESNQFRVVRHHYHRQGVQGNVQESDIGFTPSLSLESGINEHHETTGVSGIKGRVSEVKGKLTSNVHDMTGKVSDMTGKVSSTLQDKKQALQYSASRIKEKASAKLGHYSEHAQEGVQGAITSFDQMLHSNPLAIAGIAAAVGLAFGLMLPDTEFENQTVGPVRDQMVSEVKGVVQEKAAEVTQKVENLKEKAAVLSEKATQAVQAVGEAAAAGGDLAAEVPGGMELKAEVKATTPMGSADLKAETKF